MKNFLKSRAGLSTVVTTLIILVVSVLLATVVTFYAINVTTTRVQEESIQITKLHTWQDGATYAETAFLIVNTGGRDIVIDKLAVRGIAADMAHVYFVKPVIAVTADLSFIGASETDLALATLPYGTGGADQTVTQASTVGTLILKSGGSMIVYMANPDHVSVSDIGVTIGVTVFTANAQYYKESNVQASS